MRTPEAAAASRVARASGSSFLPSFWFLPRARRDALSAIYAFCREVDDAGDLLAPEAARRAVAFWRQELDRAYEGVPQTAIGRALQAAVAAFGVPRTALLEVVRGVEMDLDGVRYATFTDLVVYLRRVASAVGVACLPVFGALSPEALVYADRLGQALQLTNIVRDVGEDARRGRVYLPDEDLARFGLDGAGLRAACADEASARRAGLAALLRFEIALARDLLTAAERVLPAGHRRALLPARIMAAIYRRVLERVADDPVRALFERQRLPAAEKALVAVETWLRRADARER